MKSSSTGSDSSPFMKVKEELLRQRKRGGLELGERKKGNKGRKKGEKKGSKEDDVAPQIEKRSRKQQTSRPQRALTIMGTSGILHRHSGTNLMIMTLMLWR